jgi:hypothetical protein
VHSLSASPHEPFWTPIEWVAEMQMRSFPSRALGFRSMPGPCLPRLPRMLLRPCPLFFFFYHRRRRRWWPAVTRGFDGVPPLLDTFARTIPLPFRVLTACKCTCTPSPQLLLEMEKIHRAVDVLYSPQCQVGPKLCCNSSLVWPCGASSYPCVF